MLFRLLIADVIQLRPNLHTGVIWRMRICTCIRPGIYQIKLSQCNFISLYFRYCNRMHSTTSYCLARYTINRSKWPKARRLLALPNKIQLSNSFGFCIHFYFSSVYETILDGQRPWLLQNCNSTRWRLRPMAVTAILSRLCCASKCNSYSCQQTDERQTGEWNAREQLVAPGKPYYDSRDSNEESATERLYLEFCDEANFRGILHCKWDLPRTTHKQSENRRWVQRLIGHVKSLNTNSGTVTV